MTDTKCRTTDIDDRRLALLIDADNVSPRIAPGLFTEIAAYGTIGVRRIYTNWTSTNARVWKDCLALYAIQPVQQFAHAAGRNASDNAPNGAMIIDAMDLLHSQRFSGFCLVSSDRDFARLAIRIREQGVAVYGLGDRHAPRAFIAGCDRFVYLDTLCKPGQAPCTDGMPIARHLAARSATLLTGSASAQGRLDDAMLNMLEDVVVAVADADGRATLAAVGAQILKLMPDFDVRHYGFAKLSDLAEACDFIGVERVGEVMQAITVWLLPIHSDAPPPKKAITAPAEP
jgi:hypothetical protein